MCPHKVRGRAKSRTDQTLPDMATALPHAHRSGRTTSRPRTFFALASPSPALPAQVPRSPDFAAKKNAARRSYARVVPTGAVASMVILALFIFYLLVSRNLDSFLHASRVAAFPDAASNSELLAEHDSAKVEPLALPAKSDMSETTDSTTFHTTADVRLPPPRQDDGRIAVDANEVATGTIEKSERNASKKTENSPAQAPQALPDAQPQTGSHTAVHQTVEADSNSDKDTIPSNPDLRNDLSRANVRDSGQVSWIRSWPDSVAYDHTSLIPLAAHLKFTNRTLLNYFHMHKTGGVTTKSELMHVLDRSENKPQLTKRGQRMRYEETCYQQEKDDASDTTLERNWRCDFGQVKGFSKEHLATIDVVMGHQYWEKGCDFFFGEMRDVRYFSLFRHPLPRKLSFFYHFFVRNLGREETDADKDEVVRFLLGDMPADPRARDSGPNYYASRMLSDGQTGFSSSSHQYIIPREKEDAAIAKVLDKLDNRFAFVGLQLQTEASQCMLEKAIQVVTHEHGIDGMVGTPSLTDSTKRLNSGQYPWTAHKIWAAMTSEQKEKYKKVERVDLAIYKKAVQRFKEDVKSYSCSDKVDEEEWAEDVFE